MVLLLDIDRLFSDFLPDYIDKHCAGLTPEEIENKIVRLSMSMKS